MGKVKVWTGAPYGVVGSAFVPLEVAKMALERGGYPTRMEGKHLMYEMELDDTDPAVKQLRIQTGRSMSFSERPMEEGNYKCLRNPPGQMRSGSSNPKPTKHP